MEFGYFECPALFLFFCWFKFPALFVSLPICSFPHFLIEFWQFECPALFSFYANLNFPHFIWSYIYLSICNIANIPQFFTGKQIEKKCGKFLSFISIGFFGNPKLIRGNLNFFALFDVYRISIFRTFWLFLRIKEKKYAKFMIVSNIISYNLWALMALSSDYRGQTPFISICQSNEAPLKFLVLAIL